MIRTFIALEIPKSDLSRIILIRDQIISQDKRILWEPLEKLHITLKFLGDVQENLIPVIKDELQSIAECSEPCLLSFKKFGVFSKGNDPKILFVDLNDCVNLNRIVSRIEESFTKIGFKKETRNFKPHVTLLRFKGSENKNEILKLLEASIPQNYFKADKMHLLKSELKPSGSIYTSIQKYLLKKWRRKNEFG